MIRGALVSSLLALGCRHAQPAPAASPGPPARPAVTVVPAPGLVEPFAVAIDRAGNTYIAEMGGNRVRRLDRAGRLTAFAGTGERGFGGDGGPATAARLAGPHHVLILPDSDDVYIADTFNDRLRKVDARTGIITTVAGTGVKGFSGDGGPAVAADFGGIYSVDLDPRTRALVVADLDSRRVRAISLATGVVTTVAGNGDRGVPPDGADARRAPLVDPRAAAVDGAGRIYVVERGGHALRVVDTDGTIRTVAGTGRKGPGPAAGDARQVALDGPKHAFVDRDGSVLICDTENHRVRRYRPATGRLEPVLGTGAAGAGDPTAALDALAVRRPHGVFVDRGGVVYVSDSDNHRVLRIAGLAR